jgi:hypothetical protein
MDVERRDRAANSLGRKTTDLGRGLGRGRQQQRCGRDEDACSEASH